MENPEEVLQALDEFQKLRPADIPKELEEYLSWVAKTGDPVYQWPLIKALFREKLLRVMTDFYENCPTLELAPCPNVEQFNYDNMKSALLERLESFANAPFTVQRICELLTAPRKEYNRVDKFMRAIEKNILVVSTREPGPTARRSENGDGMVNGSTEDNGSRSPYDMDLWARACTLATTVTVQTVESHSTIVNIHHLPTNIIPATELTIVKSNPVSVEAFAPYGTDTDICDSEITAKSQDLPSTFTPSMSEIANIANLTSQIQPQDPNSTSGIQNLSNMVPEPTNIVGDVPEAIMNEDTNSQPSLDMETNENESFESTRKLQTTFQSSDFITHSIKSQKFYSDEAKQSEKTTAKGESLKNDLEPLIDQMDQKPAEHNIETTEANLELKSQIKNEDSTPPTTVITSDSIEMTENIDKTSNEESSAQSTVQAGEKDEVSSTNEGGVDPPVKESVVSAAENVSLPENESKTASLNESTEKVDTDSAEVNLTSTKETETMSSVATTESVVSCTIEGNVKITRSVTTVVETEVVTETKDLKITNKNAAQLIEETQSAAEGSKETDEVKKSKEQLEKNEEALDKSEQLSSITIEEISSNDETESTISNVPDPLPIIEEPKNEDTTPQLDENQPSIEDVDAIENKSVDLALPSVEVEKKSIDSSKTENIQKVDLEGTDVQPNRSSSTDDSSMITDAVLTKEVVASSESMEIDSTEENQTFQQDEPMEEEAPDLDKS